MISPPQTAPRSAHNDRLHQRAAVFSTARRILLPHSAVVRIGRLIGASVFAFLGYFLAPSASAQVVSNTFEDGTTQGWITRGPVILASSTEVARSGTASLKTTGRTSSWNGPSLNLRSRVAANATYQVTGWVRLLNGTAPTDLRFTLERTPVGGTTSFAQVTPPQIANADGWVQLQGTLTVPAGDNTTLLLYLESNSPTVGYYLDDFSITALSAAKCPEPLDQSGLMTNFESGGAQGWSGRGSATVTNVTSTAQAGTHSLAVTGRTASWNGATINTLCKIHKGFKYLVSVWVRLLPGEPASQVRVSLQGGLSGNQSFYTVIGNTMVTDATWVNLATEYTFGFDVDELQLYVETNSGTASYYLDEFALINVPAKPIQTAIPSVHEVLADYFPIGAALEPPEINGVHGELFLKHFNQFTIGNALKWDATQPTEGVFTFARADTLAAFAREHGLRVRGHTLVWHDQTPAWVFRDADGNPLQPGNAAHRTLLLQRLEDHIHTVVTRYADVIYAWDVVNEVIDDSQPNGLRNSPWLQIIGPEYIDWAFEFAREASATAQLYINDFNTTVPTKRAALQNVVQGLRSRSVPVDGVGHQMHVNVEWPPVSDIRQTLELFAGMGLKNEITEMDISVYTNPTDTAPVSAETLVLQGYRYRDIFNLYRELSPIIESVTLWGLGDDGSWLKSVPITRDDKPLLFDEDLQAKPAYWGVVDPSKLPLIPKTLNVTRHAARINGVEDLFWDTIAARPLSASEGTASESNFRAVWNGTTLFVLAEVVDPTRSLSDAVDIYVGTARYSFRGFGRQRPNGAEGLILPTRAGYRLEAALPAGTTLAIGNRIAFDLRVTDSATGKKLSWSDTRHAQDTDSSNFGSLSLIAEKRLVGAVRGTPVIDGLEDTPWRRAEKFETRTFVEGTAGATAEVRALWDDDHLYILARVTDPVLGKTSPNVWEQDSIEIFVDTNNAQTASYEADDAQYRINFDNERSFGGGATAAKIISATRRIAGGYIVEAAIALDPPSTAGRRIFDRSFIGFDLQVNNDSLGDGVRTSVATWNDTTGTNFLDPSHFGALQLKRLGW